MKYTFDITGWVMLYHTDYKMKIMVPSLRKFYLSHNFAYDFEI